MLVLSRKEGEQIVIGDDIRVTISKLSGNRVRVAIDAPEEITIRRGELEYKHPRLSTQSNAGSAGNSNVASAHVAAQHA